MRFPPLLGLLAVALLLGCSDRRQEAAPVSRWASSRRPRPMAVPEGVVEGKDIVCGYVTVPEHHGSPDSRTLKLAVARLASLTEDPLPDPLVPLPTGPGASALDSFLPVFASPLGAPIRATRDVVLFEQRGLYRSKPTWRAMRSIPSSSIASPRAWAVRRASNGPRRHTRPAVRACWAGTCDWRPSSTPRAQTTW